MKPCGARWKNKFLKQGTALAVPQCAENDPGFKAPEVRLFLNQHWLCIRARLPRRSERQSCRKAANDEGFSPCAYFLPGNGPPTPTWFCQNRSNPALSNKINAPNAAAQLIWTALKFNRPFGTQPGFFRSL